MEAYCCCARFPIQVAIPSFRITIRVTPCFQGLFLLFEPSVGCCSHFSRFLVGGSRGIPYLESPPSSIQFFCAVILCRHQNNSGGQSAILCRVFHPAEVLLWKHSMSSNQSHSGAKSKRKIHLQPGDFLNPCIDGVIPKRRKITNRTRNIKNIHYHWKSIS